MGMTIWTGAFVFSPRAMRLSSVNTPFGPSVRTVIVARSPLPDAHTVSQAGHNVNKQFRMCVLCGVHKGMHKVDAQSGCTEDMNYHILLHAYTISHIFEN